MQKVTEFLDQTEALLARDALRARGIHCEIQGGKEYTTHVLGGTQGHYFLFVSEDQVSVAEDYLNSLRSSESTPEPKGQHFRKSIMWAFIAVVLLPLIGNWISIREAARYAKDDRSERKWIWLFLISWLQVPGILLGFWLLMSFVRIVMNALGFQVDF